MATTVADLVAQVVDETGFDVSAAGALRWYNARHSRLIAEARWLRMTIDVDDTVAGQDTYAAPDVVELYELSVAGYPYGKARRVDLTLGRLRALSLTGPGGVFVASADDAGAATIQLYPVPDVTGDAIVAFAAVRPPAQITTDVPLVPDEFFDAIVDGMIATGLARDTEQVGAADRFEARFDAAIEKLRRLGMQRLAGGGPSQIRVAQ